MSYHQQLKQFLAQAKTNSLRTIHYDREYHGTTVKVGFGQGTQSRVPWISFLLEPNTTQNGIYPAYLYYKEFDLLVLSYCISVANNPIINWDLHHKKTIEEYILEKFGKKIKFGSSFIFKTYDANNLPSDKILDDDLNTIIDEYTDYLKKQIPVTAATKNTTLKMNNFRLDSFNDDLKKSGLQYSRQLLSRFVASLLTKPFVILTGLSGSGKTKLAQAFVQWICQKENQYRIIPVGADWTNREPLLGYPNALKPDEYVKPDSGVLDLIIQANNNKDLPHFLILDEMNLSHVERYFADFLSVMESKKEIPLYAEGTVNNGVPASLKLPANLFIIGTVNIDETTNMFSPKVLDRANTIEFRVSQDEMNTFLSNIKEIKMEALDTKGAGMAENFLEMSSNHSFATTDLVLINDILIQFFGELKKTGAEFGYRSASEILRLIHQLSALDDTLTIEKKIDIAIMQKLLPKLHGSRRKLCPVLETLGGFCLDDKVNIIKDVFEKDNFNYSQSKYPLSLEKIARMYKGAIDNGFASFAEA